MKRGKGKPRPALVAPPSLPTEPVVVPVAPPTKRKPPKTAFKAGFDPRRGHGCEKGAPNAGRPPRDPNAWRIGLRDLLSEEGITAAREMLLGHADSQGRVATHSERMRLIELLTEIAYNERVRIAQLRAEAAAQAGTKATAGVQLILQGGPAGNLQPT